MKYLKLFESPDTLDYNGDELFWKDDDAIAFFIETNSDHTKAENLFVAKRKGRSHDSIGYYGLKKSYAGRLWLYSRIIAFWVYPNEKLFMSIIKKLEEELNIKMLNNNWKIEVIKSKEGIEKRKYFPTDDPDDYYFGSRQYSVKQHSNSNYLEIIPIEEYAGSEDVPEEEQIMHLMNWKEKDLAMKAGKYHFSSFGSYKTGWDQPRNIKYRQKIYQENKNNK